MKKWMIASLCLALVSCSNVEETPEPVSTVDSNLADEVDTVLPELYIDSHEGDTTFSIALDSAGPTILPGDTDYNKPKN
jgi:hypothetical protein